MHDAIVEGRVNRANCGWDNVATVLMGMMETPYGHPGQFQLAFLPAEHGSSGRGIDEGGVALALDAINTLPCRAENQLVIPFYL